MATYNFNKIITVPTSKDFIDFTLSKTNRKTPTIVHAHYKITRVRSFYMRKVKYTQQNFHDRLNTILTQFPKIEDVHPFYADLLNTLYNKDHYKLSLGQLNIALHLIDKVASDYVKLLKFGDSLYRCKQLKRAALGRMVTIMKKQIAPLRYLEEVRQHMSRLPTIDPNTRTLILCGCPNAGKSSFMNQVTRADVDVQPYPFTTKSLFVGHTDYEYLQWQVIDTPGLLDRPFDEMNTIELQAITALAHIRAAIIFFVDISETCEVSIEKQMNIFGSIRPLFANKPLVVACNKVDIVTLNQLKEKSPEKHELIMATEKEGAVVMESSSISRDGIMNIRKEACDRLLAQRVDAKLRTRKVNNVLNRIHVAEPFKRDNKERKPFIPEKVVELNDMKKQVEAGLMEAPPRKKLEKDLEEELDYEYTLDTCKTKILENDEWKYDKLPDMIDGFNVADFIDPDIEEKFAELLAEEQKMIDAGVYNIMRDPYTPEELEMLDKYKKIMEKIDAIKVMRAVNRKQHRRVIERSSTRQVQDRSTTNLRLALSEKGVDMTKKDTHFTKTVSVADRGRSERHDEKRKRDVSLANEGASTKRRRSESRPHSVVTRARSSSLVAYRNEKGVRGPEMLKAQKAQIRRELRRMNKGNNVTTRRKISEKPKHLFSGKSSMGSADRR